MSAETKFKIWGRYTDGLVNGEIIGEGQLGRMRLMVSNPNNIRKMKRPRVFYQLKQCRTSA